jgi:type II secretory pathway component PulK
MRRRRERGVVLIIALAVLAGLVALVASVAASQQLAVRAEANRINSVRARIAAEAGIQRALAAIAGTIQDTSTATTGTAATGTTVQGQAQLQTDEWYTLGNKGEERFTVGGATFRIEIVDAGSLVNLNTALEAQLNQLPLTTEQVASLLDWREVGTTARTEGAKDEYYNALEKPYNAKLRRMDSFDELLNIRYFTPVDLYQVNDNSSTTTPLPALTDGRQAVLYDLATVDSFNAQLQPSGTAMVNINTANVSQRLVQAGMSLQTAQTLAPGTAAPSFADIGAVLATVRNPADQAIVLDAVTTSPATRVEGKINLNTASEAVLMSIPQMTQDLAQGIVAYQSTGFTKLSDLLQVSGFTDTNNLQRFAPYFTVRSSIFLVRIVGECGGTQVALEAVVDTSSQAPRLIKMHDQPYSDMPTRWGWQPDPTNDTVLVASN